MTQPTKTSSWNKLASIAQSLKSDVINEYQCKEQAARERYKISTNNILLDFSSQRVDDSILQLLYDLAESCNLKQNIKDLLSGSKVNSSENIPALHTALRTFDEDPILVLGQDIIPEVLDTRERMQEIANQIRQGQWLGFSGQIITDVVNIGIGGSQLGPFFCLNALQDYISNKLGFHFISDFDSNAFRRVVERLNPETTLFIVSSKSFATQETLHNAKKAMAWINQPQHIDKHFIAVTANRKRAQALGINTVLPIWDWVGGRYSLCSAINLITCIAIGYEAFMELLAGAHIMDRHFYNADFSSNMPVLMALLGIWNINFLDRNNLLILSYAHDLQYLVPYIQQLDMESNGKSIDKQGQPVQYATGPIIWGGLGNQAQHSYYQLLRQGTPRIAADLITVDIDIHTELNQVCNAQKTVLTQGMTDACQPQKNITGRTPLNHLMLKEYSPKVIGALISLYEHKIFSQSVIWNINPFDQPGVESSKKLIAEAASPDRLDILSTNQKPF